MKTLSNPISSWRFTLVALTSTLALSLNLSAADPTVDTSKLPPAAKKSEVTFTKDIQPILEQSCAKCHGGNRPKGKYRVDTAENVIKGGGDGKAAVVKGKSDKSPIVWFVADLVEEYEMPPLDKRDEMEKLTKDQIALLRAWIDQGAK